MGLGAVAFDLMDTVVADPYREALTAASSVPLAELFASRGPEAWPAFERGELSEDEFFATFEGVGFDVEVFHRTRRQGYRFVPGMDELLRDLEGEVERIGATNYPIWVEELADGLLRSLLDGLVASCHVGVRKPKPAFYEAMREAIGLPGPRILFVDDREENVQGAADAGLRAHLFTGADDLRERLRTEGIEI